MALKGLKVVEIMGLAPGPLCGTILADFGATVTVVQRIEPAPFDVMSNGKKLLSINLKTKEGVKVMRKLSANSDIFLDTFRPGVMENLGLGPKLLLQENPRLVYARLTGYGQEGYLKTEAGHDINYVAMSGILSLLSRNNQPPTPPVNLLADFAGGSLMCVLGILLALFERSESGKGQIVDCGMTEGLAYLATWLFKSRRLPIWSGKPGTNALDGGLSQYGTYKTRDGKFMAVGALEPQFYENFLRALDLSDDEYSQITNYDTSRNKLEEIFLTKTQNEWSEIFENTNACVTPVLDLDSIDKSKYYSNGKSFYRDSADMIVPETAPKLSRTPGTSVGRKPIPVHGQHTYEILRELGYSNQSINALVQNGCVYSAQKSNL
ncbi:Alpha-methylacyl-CoA racemase [Operophtera brumata]|uniref:Alpha-methylacyl-CoA racemase n=1 Tax=Operophtera brumata TaxID=104452 RepID=A0A0L7LKE9_OPEBR|nr:Alpha-methylacyl-CoA racemase [Operophtera brumata]